MVVAVQELDPLIKPPLRFGRAHVTRRAYPLKPG